ncbi:Aspartate aminotransferase (EC [Olavius sp. associated proteobacterium Delta 1]|nr:Aspartate aminotransferase (EC [Olavius sp. associated proteobacterium Delta 1]
MKLTSKLPNLSLTIFSEMTQLADAHGAINLSQGFPDYAVPEELTALVANYMQQGYNQYAPMQGVQHLRDQIAAKVLELYGAKYDPAREITVTSGATEALFAAITAVVRVGDEVYEHILFDGCTHQRMTRYPQLAERSFVISSFGKTYHATGWKIGYCLAPIELSREVQKIHQYLTFASNTPVQHAFAEFMQKKDGTLEKAAERLCKV